MQDLILKVGQLSIKQLSQEGLCHNVRNFTTIP